MTGKGLVESQGVWTVSSELLPRMSEQTLSPGLIESKFNQCSGRQEKSWWEIALVMLT